MISSPARPPVNQRICAAIVDRYRCLEQFMSARIGGPLSDTNGYFRFGDDLICYGRSSSSIHAVSPQAPLPDLMQHVRTGGEGLLLPFDPTDIIDTLRYERYLPNANGGPPSHGPVSPLRDLYYSVRPLLPLSIRKHLQRLYLRGWDQIPFPRWPLDTAVEDLLETLLRLVIESTRVDAVPFIWFWPDGATAAAIMTHDVETTAGQKFCPRLMDIDESFGIRSSFQIVPEQRYVVTSAFLDQIRARDHEVNVQDLNHDGHLFRDRKEFENRAEAINRYGRQFRARGFRSAVLYHNVAWYHWLEFEYDMSIPNVGHLDPQRGGCCTVFPYFIGNILELPVTTTQDYSLFHILRDYRLDLWKVQASGIMAKHGLLSFIAHPDYLQNRRAADLYRGLLHLLSRYRSEAGLWITTPNEVNEWWRQRSHMTLVSRNGEWQIEGPGSERTRVAYAKVEGGQLLYSFNC